MGFLDEDKIECFFLSCEFNTGFFLLAVKMELLVLVTVVLGVLPVVLFFGAREPVFTLSLELNWSLVLPIREKIVNTIFFGSRPGSV